jgi:hypothetical protein
MKHGQAVIVALLVGTATAHAAPLPFIADDFDRARATATARKLPMFVEVWAPW